jgi:hypothetical protein
VRARVDRAFRWRLAGCLARWLLSTALLVAAQYLACVLCVLGAAVLLAVCFGIPIPAATGAELWLGAAGYVYLAAAVVWLLFVAGRAGRVR